MKRFFLGRSAAFVVAVCLAATSFSAISSARAAQPPTVEQSPSVVQQCAADHPHYLFVAPTNRGYGQFVPAQAYAYGWFGACSKSHAVFHWDYYDHRWIWW